MKCSFSENENEDENEIKTISSYNLNISKKFTLLTTNNSHNNSNNSNKDNNSNNKDNYENNENKRKLEKKVSIEVVLTEEKLLELMKCKPTEEWISKTGKSLKYNYPELDKAHQKDLQKEQKLIKKSKVILI